MDCLFCKIINGEIPSEKVYEDDMCYGFKDINPMAKVHVVIVPKIHFESANDINEENAKYAAHIFSVAKKIAKLCGIDESGYRIVNNCGKNAGQTVFHIHFHLLGGENLADFGA